MITRTAEQDLEFKVQRLARKPERKKLLDEVALANQLKPVSIDRTARVGMRAGMMPAPRFADTKAAPKPAQTYEEWLAAGNTPEILPPAGWRAR